MTQTIDIEDNDNCKIFTIQRARCSPHERICWMMHQRSTIPIVNPLLLSLHPRFRRLSSASEMAGGFQQPDQQPVAASRFGVWSPTVCCAGDKPDNTLRMGSVAGAEHRLVRVETLPLRFLLWCTASSLDCRVSSSKHFKN